jgi:hypothetical protein
MRSRRRGALALGVGVAVAVALLACTVAVASARPGGGGSFSGGGSSRGGGGGGGGGSGGGDGALFLIWLLFEHPVIGVPVVIIVLVLAVKRTRNRSQMTDWSSMGDAGDAGDAGPPEAPSPVRRFVRRQLEDMRSVDENFSLILLEDFLYALYAEVHTARGQGKLARYSAFLAPGAAASLEQRRAAGVRNIVIGAMAFTDARGTRGDEPQVSFGVRYESNFTEVGADGSEQSYYVEEDWWLSRKRGVTSRTPDRSRLFVCPSCGAPLDAVTAGTCAHCGRLVSSGEFDWVVQQIDVVNATPRGPMLTGDTEEEGTDESTLVDPGASAAMQTLLDDDPALSWETFQGRVGLIFGEFQIAWSGRDLAKMRAYLSDRLFETQTFWIEAYKAQGLQNVTDNARILGIELARVGRDRFFDAVTVRVWATSLDYTRRDADARIVSGSSSRERRYSEYWTLIRSRSRKGPTHTERVCPNCGAPLDVNMAGACKYCKAKVTAGDFDWVLSRIEQDEVYAG